MPRTNLFVKDCFGYPESFFPVSVKNVMGILKYPFLYPKISTALAPAQSKKLLFAAESDHPRKPQLVTLSRTTHHGYPSPADTSATLLQTTRRYKMLQRILLPLNKGKYKKEIS